MEPEDVISRQRHRQHLVVALVACFGLAMIAQMGRSCLISRAEAKVTAIEQQDLKATEQAVKNLMDSFGIAKTIHHPQYLERFDLASLEPQVARAKAQIKTAHETGNPDQKRLLSEQARQLLAVVSSITAERQAYLKLLDTAKDNYLSNIAALRTSIFGANGEIEKLVQGGFFKSNFAPMEELIGRAENSLQEATRLNGILLNGVFPDYLKIWQVAKEGSRIAEEAAVLIRGIPERVRKNDQTISTVRQGIEATVRLYPRAMAAAEHLNRYPRYV